MLGIIVRYTSNDDDCLLKGNDYIAIESEESQYLIWIPDPEDSRNSEYIWYDKKNFKPVQHVTASYLVFKGGCWYYELIGTLPNLEAYPSDAWSIHSNLDGEVKKIAPHIYQIESEKDILIVHLIGNFELSEKGKMVIEHLTR
ncbi:MAG: hypothetical protein IKG14_01290 [Clostridia bacterium]|nr:hypothetical protein [Clostridia bacterium]